MTTKERAEKAANVVKIHNELYPTFIKHSIDETKIYRNGTQFQKLTEPLKIRVENPVSFELTAEKVIPVLRYLLSNSEVKDKKIAVLNFGNYKNAGGRFLLGGQSQEETLCQNSYLYNVLSAFDKDYYQVNQRKVNKCLYTDAALYSPDIKFFLLDDIPNQPFNNSVDVLTCSPPNIYASNKYYSLYGKYRSIIKERLKFIKAICELNGVEIFIAGAWGCGSYDGMADLLAAQFLYLFQTSSTIEKIIFAIPSTSNLKQANEYRISHNFDVFNRRIKTFKEKERIKAGE